MLGVAVLELGRIGPTHASVVPQANGVELKAVAEKDEAKLGAVVDGLPGVTGYGESPRRPPSRRDLPAPLAP